MTSDILKDNNQVTITSKIALQTAKKKNNPEFDSTWSESLKECPLNLFIVHFSTYSDINAFYNMLFHPSLYLSGLESA